jgi:hypothetical protein
MPILPDPHRPFPDALDDAAMDEAERLWIAEQEADDACRDDEQAEEATRNTVPARDILIGHAKLIGDTLAQVMATPVPPGDADPGTTT